MQHFTALCLGWRRGIPFLGRIESKSRSEQMTYVGDRMATVSLQNPAGFLRHYIRADFRGDALAALSIVVTGIPQAMAYAVIAGVPPVYGLYTAIVSCIIAAVFGSSRHLVTGPTNATCMVIFSLTAPYMGQPNHLEVVLLLTLMTGLLKLIFGLFRLGSIVRYVSNSVVMGFTTGVGILIAGNQLSSFMGIQIGTNKSAFLFPSLYQTILHISQLNPRTFFIAALTAFIAFYSRKINRKIPGSLIGVCVAGTITYLFGWHAHGVRILSDIAPIERSLRIFSVPQLLVHPDLGMMRSLGAGALALAIFGLLEAATSSRAVAALSGQRLNFSREFVAQGLANIGGAFFSNFASSASFIRTAECYHAGGRTRFASALSGLFTGVVIIALAPVANYIPIGSLAGLLVVIAYSLVQKERLRMTWMSGRNSRLVFLVTLSATILIPLQYAVFVGIFMSLVFLLKITGKPDLTQLVPRPDGHFDEVPFGQVVETPIVLINLEGDFYFAAVEDLEYELHRVLASQTRVVVLRMKRLRAVGSTAMAILDHFCVTLNQRDISLVVCGLEPELANLIARSGLRQRIGEQNIFYADNTIFRSTELAMARARHIIEMARLREAAGAAQPSKERSAAMSARDLVSRQCVRFGENHTLREAIWLLSEMSKRLQATTAQPLFLQNREGKLAGMLSPYRILEILTTDLDPANVQSDSEWASGLLPHFGCKIQDIALADLPRIHLESPFFDILRAFRETGLDFLPILDSEGRVTGLISSLDLLAGIGKIMHPHARQ